MTDSSSDHMDARTTTAGGEHLAGGPDPEGQEHVDRLAAEADADPTNADDAAAYDSSEPPTNVDPEEHAAGLAHPGSAETQGGDEVYDGSVESTEATGDGGSTTGDQGDTARY